MNRSPQYDVYFYAENASGTPNYPGTYSTLTIHQHGTIPSHRTQKWINCVSPHTVHYFATHEEYNRENTNDKL